MIDLIDLLIAPKNKALTRPEINTAKRSIIPIPRTEPLIRSRSASYSGAIKTAYEITSEISDGTDMMIIESKSRRARQIQISTLIIAKIIEANLNPPRGISGFEVQAEK